MTTLKRAGLSLLGLLFYLFRRHEGDVAQCSPEARGRNYRQLAQIGIVLVTITLFVAAALWGSLIVYPSYRAHSSDPLLYRSQYHQMPALDESAAQELEERHLDADRRLHDYGWTSPERDAAHIPIGRAIERLVEQGGALR